MRWFGAPRRRATPKGQNPSSSVQHRFRNSTYRTSSTFRTHQTPDVRPRRLRTPSSPDPSRVRRRSVTPESATEPLKLQSLLSDRKLRGAGALSWASQYSSGRPDRSCPGLTCEFGGGRRLVSCERGSFTWAAVREYLVSGLGPGEGVAAVVPAVDEVLDGGDEILTEVKLSRRMACRVMIEKKTSTHVELRSRRRREVQGDPAVPDKPGAHVRVVAGAVAVADDAQLAAGVCGPVPREHRRESARKTVLSRQRRRATLGDLW